ncbi:MAG: fructose-bisphosphate aldolase [Armatimonadota bacterium]|nr:fructose-bisphosphate aldolase [Armatimonadota bacterium]MDR7519649.1 fructose-bisphosphate aldolase [Armatimonadota bacterium]MDR7551099.1 fructose-bisphosphate aldolase [Armatimonadota bacterium]
MVIERVKRPTLEAMPLAQGKRARLYRLLYEHGPGHGTMLVLPVDQGLEHGPVDFLPNPPSENPEFQIRLAIDGGYSAIAFHYGIAARYLPPVAGKIPLILKINGKTDIPPADRAFSGLTGRVEDAVRLGADAVGYTLYVGSPRQDEDFRQLTEVRADCDRYGMPLVVWSYPRGEAIEKKGGRDSLYAVDYAARVAAELGADVIKLNVPVFDEKAKASPRPYGEMQLEYRAAVEKVVRSAGQAFVLFSGGSKIGDEDLLDKARLVMEAGATGLIFGRNMWQRSMPDALRLTAEIKRIMLAAVA